MSQTKSNYCNNKHKMMFENNIHWYMYKYLEINDILYIYIFSPFYC